MTTKPTPGAARHTMGGSAFKGVEMEENEILQPKLDPHEMLRLRDMLDVAGVEYVRNDATKLEAGGMRWQTKSPEFHIEDVDDYTAVAHGWSVVLSPFSYGGADGRLEAWVDGESEPFGYLTADEVMEKLRKKGIA